MAVWQTFYTRLNDWFGRQNTTHSGHAELLHSAPSASGTAVSVDRALQLSTVYRCVSLISGIIASMPVSIHRGTPHGTSQVVEDHPLFHLLALEPNADMSAFEFLEAMVLDLILRGNFYARIDRGYGDKIVALNILPQYPKVQVERTERGARKFRVAGHGRKTERVYEEKDTLFIRGMGTDPDNGMSLIAYARESMGRHLAQQEMADNQMKNGVRPDIILSTQQVLNPDQRTQIRESIGKGFTGSKGAGGMMVLEAGMTVSPLSMSPKDMEFVDQSKWGVEDICRWFGVPPHMVGHSDGDTQSSNGFMQKNRQFFKTTIGPLAQRVAQQMRIQLMGLTERKRHYIHFDPQYLMQADPEEYIEMSGKAVQNGIKTPNEVRSEMGLPDLEGGDQLLVQRQMTPLNIVQALAENELRNSNQSADNPEGQEIQSEENNEVDV